MQAKLERYPVPRVVGNWLLIGLVLVFFQIVIGGITRLTDSGLSITEWEVVRGVLPPLSEEAWEGAFEKYKTHAKTQFEQIHADMTLSEFKFIYFWEYFHRLWARSMGLVFIIPFLIFWRKGYFSAALMRRLGLVVLGAAIVASFGWIMVASGLNTDAYAWVNAYKLSIHLGLAVALFSYLLYLTLQVRQPKLPALPTAAQGFKTWGNALLVITGIQIILGGLMSGMKAGLFYPHFPAMTADGAFIAPVLFDSSQWTWENLTRYNTNAFAPALIQFLHRTTAYLLTFLVVAFLLKIWRLRGQLSNQLIRGSRVVLGLLFLQLSLGILTVVYSVGSIPPTLGVLHQAGGILLLAGLLYLRYQLGKGGEHLYLKQSPLRKDANTEVMHKKSGAKALVD